MIKIENTEVIGFEAAIRGARNPFNSWEKSDSRPSKLGYVIGPRDMNLLKTLIQAGDDHGKCTRMIVVSVDITAPLYWWKEFDTYKVGTVADSCSTMHKIHAKEFTIDDFSTEHLMPESIAVLDYTISMLNKYRDLYEPSKNKNYWWQMIQLLPSSYNQRRTVQFNYQVIRRMYKARKNHKLDEWLEFCDWVKTLPYADPLLYTPDDAV